MNVDANRTLSGRDIYAWIALGGGATLFLSFASVAHLAGRPFYALSLAGTLAVGAIVALRPAWRWTLFGMLVFGAPRFIALTAGVQSHHLLFPLFLGLSGGLLARNLFLRRGDAFGGRPEAEATGVRLFLIFIAVCYFRAIVDYYSPYVLAGYPWQDREVAPGVSANHAFFLAGLLLLHLSGPLIFVLGDRASRSAYEAKRAVPGLMRGIAVGALANLIVILLQFAGVDRFWIGTGRSMEAGRLPGLFSDSGASTILLPCALTGLFLYLVRGRNSRRFMFFAGGAIFTLGMAIGLFQGRGFYVAALGILLLPLLIFLRDRRKPREPLASGRRRWLAGLGAGTIVLALLFLGLWRSAPANNPGARLGHRFPGAASQFAGGEFFEAYKTLNLPRARQAQGGYWIFLERPGAGGGANSFMVEIRRFEERLSGIEIDNPANLFIGLAGDFGLAGLLYAALIGYLYLRNLRRRLAAGRPTEEIYLAALPLCLAPTFLFGYHIVFAEFSALLALPLLLPGMQKNTVPGKPAAKGNRAAAGWIHSGLRFLGHPATMPALLILAFAGFWTTRIDFRTPPAYWRTDHGARPGPRPDSTADADGSTLFYYKERRNFALPAGAESIRFRLMVPAPARAAFFCYGDSGRAPIRVSRPILTGTAEEWRSVHITLPVACRGRPNLEIALDTEDTFALKQEAFTNGRLAGFN